MTYNNHIFFINFGFTLKFSGIKSLVAWICNSGRFELVRMMAWWVEEPIPIYICEAQIL